MISHFYPLSVKPLEDDTIVLMLFSKWIAVQGQTPPSPGLKWLKNYHFKRNQIKIFKLILFKLSFKEKVIVLIETQIKNW